MSCAAWLLDTARPRMGGICYSSSMNRILGNSSKGCKHPVSGNRGFGIKDNGDDTWTFYSKAVDRETPFWKNTTLKQSPMSRTARIYNLRRRRYRARRLGIEFRRGASWVLPGEDVC